MKRVLISSFGIIKRKVTTLTHKQIKEVILDQGIVGEIFNFATVTINGTVTDKVTHPLDFKKELQNAKNKSEKESASPETSSQVENLGKRIAVLEKKEKC